MEFGLIAVMLGAVYHPVLVNCYAMADDYPYLWVVTTEQPGYFNWLSAMGRPIYQLFSMWLYQTTGSVCQLGYIRALTLAGTLLFGWQFYRAGLAAGWSVIEACALAVTIVTLPAYGVYIGWSVCFSTIYAACAGFLAGRLALRSSSWLRCGLVMVLLIVALMLYQPTAMAYWLAVALAVFAPRGSIRCSLSAAILPLALFVLGLALYGLIYRLHLHWLLTLDPGLADPAGRSELLGDVGAKLAFLWHSLLLSASLGRFEIQWALVLAVLGIGAAGVLVRAWRTRDRSLLLYAAGLPPLAFLPSVLAAESAPVIRVMGILSALLVIYLFFGLHVLLDGSHARRRLRVGFVCLIAGYSAVMAYHNVSRYIVDVRQYERDVIIAALREYYGPEAAAVALVRPPHRNPVTGEPALIEYGMWDTGWSVRYADVIVQQLFSELHATRRLPDIVQCAEPARRDCPELAAHPELPVIDLSLLLEDSLEGLSSAPR